MAGKSLFERIQNLGKKDKAKSAAKALKDKSIHNSIHRTPKKKDK